MGRARGVAPPSSVFPVRAVVKKTLLPYPWSVTRGNEAGIKGCSRCRWVLTGIKNHVEMYASVHVRSTRGLLYRQKRPL